MVHKTPVQEMLNQFLDMGIRLRLYAIKGEVKPPYQTVYVFAGLAPQSLRGLLTVVAETLANSKNRSFPRRVIGPVTGLKNCHC